MTGTAHSLRSAAGLVAGPVVLALFLAAPRPEGLEPAAWRTAGVGLLMAVWWITEAIPIPATALVPIALFPALGVASVGAATAPYANPVIYLFLGGFLLARGMQRWNLHRRIALSILGVLGPKPRRMIGGFMLATAALSMWVSNTATTVMMLPIGASIVDLARRAASDDDVRPFGIALMLGIAYAASIGGVATLVGTPPNAFLAGFMLETFGVTVGFAQWMLVGLPLAAAMLPVAWLVLTRGAFRVPPTEIVGSAELIRAEADRLGPVRRGEILTAAVFGATALAWVVRPLLTRAWAGLSDAGIAIGGALLLFVIPAGRRGGALLDWKTAAGLPWDVLVLFGGGLSLAGAIRSTGLATWMGSAMQGLEALPLLVIVAAAATALIFLTELSSNTASTAAFLPILASLAVGIGESPWFLVVPAALAASCAFMLPVATPPNAIVYGSGHVGVPDMARAGIVLNLAFAVMIPLLTYGLVIAVFGAEPGTLPDWASVAPSGGP